MYYFVNLTIMSQVATLNCLYNLYVYNCILYKA